MDKDVQFLFMISYWCALRMIEAVRLEKDDFILEDKELFIGMSKNKKNQYVAIPDPFLKECKRYLKNKPKGELLPDCNPQIVRTWCKKLGTMLNIPAWTTPQEKTGEKTLTHIFRKSSGKDMIYGTHGKVAPLNIIQKAMRHDTLDSTTKYLNVDLETVKEFWVIKDS